MISFLQWLNLWFNASSTPQLTWPDFVDLEDFIVSYPQLNQEFFQHIMANNECPHPIHTFFYPWSDIYINLKEWWMSTLNLKQTGLAFRHLFCGPCSKEGGWIFQCLKSMKHKTDLWEEWNEAWMWQKFICHFLRFLVAMETITLVCTAFLCLGEPFFILMDLKASLLWNEESSEWNYLNTLNSRNGFGLAFPPLEDAKWSKREPPDYHF